MRRRLFLSCALSAALSAIVAWAAAGSAQGAGRADLADEARPTLGAGDALTGRLEGRVLATVRDDTVKASSYDVRASGVALSRYVLSGAWFATRVPLGLGGRLDLDRFALRGRGPMDEAIDVVQTGVEGYAALLARWSNDRLSIEGGAGWGYASVPSLLTPGDATAGFTGTSAGGHGPVLVAALGATVVPAFGVEVAGRVTPKIFGARHGEVALDGLGYAAGGTLMVGRLERGGLRLQGLVDYELGGARSDGAGRVVEQLQHRFGLGLRLAFVRPAPTKVAVLVPPRAEPPPVAAPAPIVPARIRGVVRTAPEVPGGPPGPPLPGVRVAPGGLPELRTDAQGAFVIEGAPAGPLPLGIAAEGFLAGDEILSVPDRGEISVELLLRPNRAPALLTGLVRSDSGAPVAATLKLGADAGEIVVRADAKGRFRAELPPGTYTLSVEAPGFVTQQKRLVVAPGEQSIHNVDLVKTR